MKNIRIGNDIVVTWSLSKEGQPYSLEGMALRLYLKHAFGTSEIDDFRVDGNKITWTFYGKDQQHAGRYTLELVANEGENGMVSVDKCNFIQLTANTPCCDGDDDQNVVTEYVELTSTVNYAPVVIKEGGGGLQYAIERTVYLTENGIGDHKATFEISEEERAYNRETFEMARNDQPVFVSLNGAFAPVVTSGVNRVVFNIVADVGEEYAPTLISNYLTIYPNGDATATLSFIQTGSSARDMNNDFSKDF